MAGRKPVVQCTEKEWRELRQLVRATCPPPAGWSLVLSRSKTLEDLGTCSVMFDKKRIVIRIRHGLSYEHTCEIMTHELAHAYAWQHSPHVFAKDHDETWAQTFITLRVSLVGAKYAKVYNALHVDT